MKKKLILVFVVLTLVYNGYFVKNQWKKAQTPDVTIIGRVKMADGIGRQSIEVIKALKDTYEIGFIETYQKDFTDISSEIKKILVQKKPPAPVILFEELLTHPDASYPYYQKIFPYCNEKHIRIAYSMIEGTKIPGSWVQILNVYFDAVAVPDAFYVDVYRNSGVSCPIFEVPLVLDIADFLQMPLKEKKGDPFVFANFSSCIDRKNHLKLVRAFAKAFGNRSDVMLKIAYRTGDLSIIKDIFREIEALGLMNVDFQNIEHVKDRYLANFANIDAYISISKSEGFSIQPREAMCLGIPVIATDNTAQSTLCNTKLVRVVPSLKKEKAYFSQAESIGYIFDCEQDDVVLAMKDVYENYDYYLSKKEASRKWAEQYSVQSLKMTYQNLVKPKKVVLGDQNKVTDEFLMTDSKLLYKKYKKLLSL